MKLPTLLDAILLAGLLAGCSRPLPEEGTAAAELYRSRCGGCHHPIAPSSLKYPVWEMILPRMEQRMRESGSPPLSADERETIVAYLRKYGG